MRISIIVLTLGAVLVAIGAIARGIARRIGAEIDRTGQHWMIQTDHFAVIREDLIQQENGGMTTTTMVRVWFAAGLGWRMELTSAGPRGDRHRVFGANGSVLWAYDPSTNRYALNMEHPTVLDPRAELEVMRATAGTRDFSGALAALQQLPNITVAIVGEETVADRRAIVICMGQHASSVTEPISSDDGIANEQNCQDFARIWLDAETGWTLQAEADGIADTGFYWGTRSISFETVDPALFYFDPPTDSIQFDILD